MHVEREGDLPKKTGSKESQGAANIHQSTELLAIVFDSTRCLYTFCQVSISSTLLPDPNGMREVVVWTLHTIFAPSGSPSECGDKLGGETRLTL
jgi:hypothetical protein